MRTLVWFRRDLRTDDNTALSHACAASDDGLVAVFVASPGEWSAHDDAPVKVDFWLRNLRVLGEALARLNIPLKIVTAPTPRGVAPALLGVARECGCGALFFNHEYEVNEAARDDAVRRHFEKHGLIVRGYHDRAVLAPDALRTGAGGCYTVFSPYRRSWVKAVLERGVEVRPAPGRQRKLDVRPDPVPERVEGFESPVDPALWPAGEGAARARLELFCRQRIQGYKADRDTPALDATSRLSPYLAAGVISPRRCLEAARACNGGRLDDGAGSNPGAVQWISELVWREFYQQVLVGFPRVCMHRAFRPATDRIRWAEDEDGFGRWCEGRTGVPIVDAAMRQLRATGWMHNRLRMVAASYLTKDLFIDWRRGERFFMQHLVDGDLGSNNGGWQWSASTGTDAAPYFRIFNPVSQSRRCDPEGLFIRRWVPELSAVEGDAIHDPSELPGLLRATLEYPAPIVDHGAARERVLAAFKALDDRAAAR